MYDHHRDGVTRQHSGDDPEHGGAHGRLERHLECNWVEREIVIGAVADETYYMYLDDAGVPQSLLFLTALCRSHGLGEDAGPAIDQRGARRGVHEPRGGACRLLPCAEGELEPQLKHLWVTKEVRSDAIAIATRRHELLHDDGLMRQFDFD